MDSDPPRRPPGFGLFRSKSYHDPTPKKRGRQVLDDITYIANEARNWERPVNHAASEAETDESERDIELEARADGRAAGALLQYDVEQPSPSTSRLVSPSLQQRRQMALPPTLHLPRNLTNPLSSSPPSSPLRPAFTLSAETGTSITRRSSLTRSPSLRAPPPLRRASSSSSLSLRASQGDANGQTTTTTRPAAGPVSVGLRRTRTDSEVQSTSTRYSDNPGDATRAELHSDLQQDQDEAITAAQAGPAEASNDIHRSPERKRIRPSRVSNHAED